MREGKVNENLIWRCKCHVAILGSDGEQRWLPAGQAASFISTAVYSPVIMASHYRAAALGRLWIS